MAERQLRSRSVALELNHDSQSVDPALESLHTDSDIGGRNETNFRRRYKLLAMYLNQLISSLIIPPGHLTVLQCLEVSYETYELMS
jgi:hypothetical protein